jgi:hypothetical protein
MATQKRPCDAMNGWRSAITVHSAIPPSTARLHLNALAEQAATLAEADPNPERRRHKKLLRYLTARIARAILREVGRFENGKNDRA